MDFNFGHSVYMARFEFLNIMQRL